MQIPWSFDKQAVKDFINNNKSSLNTLNMDEAMSDAYRVLNGRDYNALNALLISKGLWIETQYRSVKVQNDGKILKMFIQISFLDTYWQDDYKVDRRDTIGIETAIELIEDPYKQVIDWYAGSEMDLNSLEYIQLTDESKKALEKYGFTDLKDAYEGDRKIAVAIMQAYFDGEVMYASDEYETAAEKAILEAFPKELNPQTMEVNGENCIVLEAPCEKFAEVYVDIMTNVSEEDDVTNLDTAIFQKFTQDYDFRDPEPYGFDDKAFNERLVDELDAL